MCAILYLICLKQSIPLTLDEIIEYAPVKKGRISKTYKLILESLDETPPLPTAKTFIRKYTELICSDQLTANNIYKESIRFLEQYELDDGRSPASLACAIVFIAAKKFLKISIIKYIACIKITAVTLRNKLKSIQEVIQDENILEDL